MRTYRPRADPDPEHQPNVSQTGPADPLSQRWRFSKRTPNSMSSRWPSGRAGSAAHRNRDERSWVEYWLGQYCHPRAHAFAGVESELQVCLRCGKVQLPLVPPCMICGLPGRREVALYKLACPLSRVSGLLCDPCANEFERRQPIRSWSCEQAPHQSDGTAATRSTTAAADLIATAAAATTGVPPP
jgi:hypothetical protein